MISRRICRIPGRNFRLTAHRLYSSSYRDNDRNSNSSSSNNNGSNSSSNNNEPNEQVPAKDVRARLSFMPVVNMPEAEFAHNAFFSLHRPLLGLSSDEERPFFSTATRHHTPNDIQKMLGIDQSAEDTEDMNDEAVTQYMMQLRPFEPPLSPSNEQVEDQETVVTLSFEDGHSAYDEIEAIHMDQSMPMYYMPESHEVVDYLTAMQEKLQYEEEREENGRRRGSNRPLVHAATAAEARRRTMSIQQYRQRTRRQRPIAMIDRKHHK